MVLWPAYPYNGCIFGAYLIFFSRGLFHWDPFSLLSIICVSTYVAWVCLGTGVRVAISRMVKLRLWGYRSFPL